MSGDKTMSSRLLTMKFMQRAAASSSTQSSGAASSSGPPSKRQRLSNGVSADIQAVETALAEEESKRAVAIERQAAQMGETKWRLSVREPRVQSKGLKVVPMGFSEIDAAENDSEEDKPGDSSRMIFGKKSENSIDDDSNSDSSDDSTGLNSLIRSSKAMADRGRDAQPEKRSTPVKLSSLTGISSASSNSTSRIKCFNCGKMGHRRSDCPQE